MFVRVSPRLLHVLSLTYQTFGPRLILNCVTEPELSSAKLSPVIRPVCGAGTCSGTPGRLVPSPGLPCFFGTVCLNKLKA